MSSKFNYYDDNKTKKSKVKMDRIDFTVLKCLTKDSRVSSGEILEALKWEKIDISERAIRKRIKRLCDKGVIKRFTVLVDEEYGGRMVTRVILVKFRNISQFFERLVEYADYLKNSPYCIFAARIGGDMDWVHCKCFPTKRLADVEDVFFRSEFADIMQEYRSYDAETAINKFDAIVTEGDVVNYLKFHNSEKLKKIYT